MERVQISIYVLLRLVRFRDVFNVEVDVQHLDVIFQQVVIDIGQCNRPVCEADLNPLDSVHPDHPLQPDQHHHDETADDHCEQIIAESDEQAKAGDIP